MTNLNEPPPELEQLLRSESDEPIVVNPGPSPSAAKRRVTFAPNQPIFNER